MGKNIGIDCIMMDDFGWHDYKLLMIRTGFQEITADWLKICNKA